MTDLSPVQRDVILAFKRLGGRGNLNDVRKAAGVERGKGTPLVNKLLAAGLLKKYQHDDYGLTPAGYQAAKMSEMDGK
jgi:DNA-binding MarR family transcriptional regulator